MMSIEEYAEKLGVKIECHEGNFYVSLRDYEKLLERLREKEGEKMKVINEAGKRIILELSTMEAAVITEALRKYGSDEAKKMVDTMMNKQEVLQEEEQG